MAQSFQKEEKTKVSPKKNECLMLWPIRRQSTEKKEKEPQRCSLLASLSSMEIVLVGRIIVGCGRAHKYVIVRRILWHG